MGKLRKVGACHAQYSLKADAKEARLPAGPTESWDKLEGGKRLVGHDVLVYIPVGPPASRLPAAWLLVHYPQAFVGPRIPSLGTDLLT